MKMRSWGWTRSFALGLALAGGAGHLCAGGPGVPGKPGSMGSFEPSTSSYTPAMVSPAMVPPGAMMGGPGMMPPPGMMQPGMMPPPGMMQPGMMQPGMMQPGMMAPGMQGPGMQGPGMQGPGMMGGPGFYPASYGGMPMQEGGPLPADGQDMVFQGPPPMGLEGDCPPDNCNAGGGCPSCGGFGSGCSHCGPIRRMLSCGPFGGYFAGRNGVGCLAAGVIPGVAGLLMPYGEGGICAQRWYDVSVGAMALKRTKQGGEAIDLTSQGIAGPIVLTTDSTSLNTAEWGLNVLVACQVGPGGNVEVGYYGLNDWDTTAVVTSSSPNLYSVFSDFGTSPFNGYDDTDRSFSQQATYRSAIHNGEVNYRRRWVGPNCWFQGSWLTGLRYFDLDESFDYSTRGQLNNSTNSSLRFFDSATRTRNALTGVQVGGDLWLNVIPGLHVGSEFKSGIYGNVAATDTTITANSIPTYTEMMDDATTAYINEINFKTVYRLNYSWAFTAGYQILQIDNVALATANFNPVAPPGFVGSTRTPFIDNQQNVTYQGLTLGAEYVW